MNANRARLAGALLALALAAPPSAHAVGSGPDRLGDPPTTVAKKKRKCKAGRIPVKVLRRTRCKRTRAALPRPRDADTRLLLLRQALDVDLGGVRDRRGRRAPTVKKLFRRLGPRAYPFMQRQLPRALAAADRAAAASRSAGAAGAGVDCRASRRTTALGRLLGKRSERDEAGGPQKQWERSRGHTRGRQGRPALPDRVWARRLQPSRRGHDARLSHGHHGNLREDQAQGDHQGRSALGRAARSSRTRSPWTATPRSTPRSETTPSSTL